MKPPEQMGVRDVFADPSVDELRSAYWEWREAAEEKILGQFGEAGYELVSYVPDDTNGANVRAVFKRAKGTGDAVGPVIGFRPLPQDD